MEMKLIGEKKTLLIKITGELDHHIATKIKEEADKLMLTTNAINVIFDFSEMTFMDSSGIGTIMGRYKKSRALGGKTIAYGVNSDTLRIIKMSGMDKVIKLTSNLEKAIYLIDKEEIHNG